MATKGPKETTDGTVKEVSNTKTEGETPQPKQIVTGHAEVLKPYIREESTSNKNEAEKVKLLALLKGIRDEMNQVSKKGEKAREQADMFIERYNFFLGLTAQLFPRSDFTQIFQPLQAGSASMEKIRLELTMMIAYIQNDIMDIIEHSQRLKEKNKWLQERIREFEIKIAGIQAIK